MVLMFCEALTVNQDIVDICSAEQVQIRAGHVIDVELDRAWSVSPSKGHG
jgi:hypothetical protein